MDKIKIKTQIRRVMSDRALKIVKCSQTKVQTTKQQQQQNDLLSNSTLSLSSSQNDLSLLSSTLQVKINSKLNNSILNKTLSSNNHNNQTNSINNKIILQPIKIVDLKDKESLINHIKSVYNDAIDSDGSSIVFGIQSIINSILHFNKINQNENLNVNEVLKEHLLKTIFQLNNKYNDDRKCDKLRIEGQMQVLLQIESLMQQQQIKNIDDDDVWEVANVIRWLNQQFKEKFKIEKFLFGEIYSNYYQISPEFVVNLMEELGYDISQNDDSDNDDQNTNSESINENNNKKTNDDSVLSNASSSANTTTNNKNDLNTSDNSFDTTKNAFDNDDDILSDAKRKKLIARFPSSTLNTSRSIMVQKKRLHLKIRSPYKSPTKCGSRNWLPNSDHIRRSPRLNRDRPSLKRPNQYTITDTPIHKQNSTRITTRQQRLIKRISFQKFKSDTIVIPDTPEKNKNDSTTNNRFIIRASPSPKKMRFN